MREQEAREIPGLRAKMEHRQGTGHTEGRIPLPTLPVGADDIQTK